MIIAKGDYVSGLWLCEAVGAKWSVWALKRFSTGLWHVILTWDRYINGQAVCCTPIQRVLFPGDTPEDVLLTKVEELVSNLELRKQSERVAFIHLATGELETIVDKIYTAAKEDERISVRVLTYDKPLPSPI